MDGTNWLALRSDIASAYFKLSESKQNVLRLRFSQDASEWDNLSKEMDSTTNGARMRVQRAITSLIKTLNEWR